MDLVVEAYNPNTVAITVSDLEISIFAQSPYVKDGKHNQKTVLARQLHNLNRKPSQKTTLKESSWPPWGTPGNGDDSHGPEDDAQTLLLGRVYNFDSALVFESRFFNRSVSTSVGELRLDKPGDGTDENGVKVWYEAVDILVLTSRERVVQHSFELIVRGVMKYQSSSLSRITRTSEIYKIGT